MKTEEPNILSNNNKKEENQNSEGSSQKFSCRCTTMAQLERSPRFSDQITPKTPKAHNSPTFEQLIHNDGSSLQSSIYPTLGRHHDQEEHISPNSSKKSVFSRVKEKAKKLRRSFSGKKQHDDNTSPSWGVSLDDDDDDDEKDVDPEYLGAPMYESELAPETCKENARQHPRAVPVVSEKHVLPSSIKHQGEEEKNKPAATSPLKTMTETVSEKLAPAYAAVSDATHTIASKISSLTITHPEEHGSHTGQFLTSPASRGTERSAANGVKISGRSSEIRDQATTSPQKYDKGVSVKEYFMHKLEPGEDDRALSHVISEAISPRKNPGEMGVVEKVKEAVTSFLQPEEPSLSTTKTTNLSANVPTSTNAKVSRSNSISSTSANLSSGTTISRSAKSSPLIPISTNAHEVVGEQRHGKILQAN